MTDRFNPEVSVVMPAYNLENVIVDSVREVCRFKAFKGRHHSRVTC